MAKKIRLVTIFIVTIMIIFGNFGVLAQPGHPGGEPETETGVLNYEGNTNEGESWEKALALAQELMQQEEGLELEEIMVIDIVFELSWTDDQGSESEPDTFSMMTSDGMHEPQSDQDSGGSIVITWDEPNDGPPLNDTWDIIIF